MPIIRCPNCNDNIEIEDDWYGRRIACPSCDKTFTPERGGGGGRSRRASDEDERDDDRPRRRPRDDDDRDDDRPRPRKRSRYDDDPPKKGSPVGWIILALVGVFVVLPCVSCIGFIVWGNTAKESFNDPWSDTAVGSPGVVTASFPKPPVTKFPNVTGSTGGEVMGYSNVNDGNKVLDAEFAVGYLDFPSGTREPLTANYPAIRQAAEQTFMDNPVITPQVARETTTTVSGYPAKETVYNDDTGNQVLRVVHLNDRPPGQTVRLVIIFAGGPHMNDADKQKFLNSVRIGKK